MVVCKIPRMHPTLPPLSCHNIPILAIKSTNLTSTYPKIKIVTPNKCISSLSQSVTLTWRNVTYKFLALQRVAAFLMRKKQKNCCRLLVALSQIFQLFSHKVKTIHRLPVISIKIINNHDQIFLREKRSLFRHVDCGYGSVSMYEVRIVTSSYSTGCLNIYWIML